jgi:YHS domain-containing protein
MKSSSRWALLGILSVLFVLVAVSVRAEPLKRVEAKRVCMVNNTAFDKDQIPVDVGGKTYFGCCEMCKGKLAQDASIRQAVDPVSGKPVDKATAIIGATPEGKVYYFESEKTFAEFGKQA